MSTPTGKVGWSSDTWEGSERGLSWFERGRAAVRAASDSLDDGCDIREVLAEHGVSVYENARGKNVFVIDTSSGERRILGWKLLGKKWDTWFAWRLLAEEQSGEPADAAAGTPESHWEADAGFPNSTVACSKAPSTRGEAVAELAAAVRRGEGHTRPMDEFAAELGLDPEELRAMGKTGVAGTSRMSEEERVAWMGERVPVVRQAFERVVGRGGALGELRSELAPHGIGVSRNVLGELVFEFTCPDGEMRRYRV